MLNFCPACVSVRRFCAWSTALFFFCLVVGCSGGKSSSPQGNTPSNVAPSNLAYPQTNITTNQGEAVANDTPSVTGTVTSYSISPALPAGMTLDATTGVISGRPTGSIATTLFTVTATNSAGTTTTTVRITVVPVPAPTGLSYPQTSISATVGQAMAADTPTVTGPVYAYSIAPALPAGLSLDSGTGALTGTPTITTPQATYTVTALNSSGSTTATLQITVNFGVAAPANFFYPQPNMTGTVGQPVVPDIPYLIATEVSFAISPALPPGLNLDSSTGTITGTPTAILSQTSYTVTASNSSGSVTAPVSVAVGKAYTTLLELGHSNSVTLMRSTTDRLLSQGIGGSSGHWVLWDSASGSELAMGDQYFPYVYTQINTSPVDMAGSTIAIGQVNGLEVRSSVDGHLLSIISAPTMIDPYFLPNGNTWWKLASDGSYICAGSADGLAVWSPSGQQLLFRQGNYSNANVFPAPGQIMVALGMAGANTIETIAVGSGQATNGPTFSGSFNSWFLDGQRFLTNTGNTVWTYSAAGVQQTIATLPSIQNLVGMGSWIISSSMGSTGEVAIYAAGASSASATYPSPLSTVVSSGQTLAIFSQSSSGSVSVVDLSGSAPVKTDFTMPTGHFSAYASPSPSKWFIANDQGVVTDGTNPAHTLSYGQAWSIAAGTTKVAIATANGVITYLNPVIPTATGTIAFSSSKVALSSDDTILAASGNSRYFQYATDRTLNLYSLPSGTVSQSFPYSINTPPYLLDFIMSDSGNVLEQTLTPLSPSSLPARSASAIGGGAPVWSDTFNSTGATIDSAIGSVQLSPDGTSVAAAGGPMSGTVGTNIYKNGLLITAVPGWPLAWLDNNRLLVKNYASGVGGTYTYTGSAIYDSSGSNLATLALPELTSAEPTGSDQIYSSDHNSVYSLTTGSATWSGGTSPTAGAVAGQYVVFAKGSKVILDTY